VNHAACINMYLGITMFGITSPHVVAAGSTGMTTKYKNKKGFMARNITSDEYKDVLRGTFCPRALASSASKALLTGCFSKTMTQHTMLHMR